MKRRRTVRESASIEPPPGCYVAGVAGHGPPDAFSCPARGTVWAGPALVDRAESVALTVDAPGRVGTVRAP
ncbi:hypothetical protein ACFWRV_00860 [Streptomyces sp. NPDC058576]|uniref:hypothetical protein n=1 Tax=Streptomyces sp. NPDC058576 TaxID=3346547 RepID=UPI0036629451